MVYLFLILSIFFEYLIFSPVESFHKIPHGYIYEKINQRLLNSENAPAGIRTRVKSLRRLLGYPLPYRDAGASILFPFWLY